MTDAPGMRISSWQPNSTGVGNPRAYFTLTLPSGLVFKRCMWMEKGDGSAWVGFPGSAQIDRNGIPRRDDRGMVTYTNIVDFDTKAAKDRFQSQACAAVRDYRAKLADA